MNKLGHILLGIFCVFSFIFLCTYLGLDLFSFSFSSIAFIFGLTFFYCLLPDIDHKNSTITWIFFGIGVIGLVVAILELFLNLEFFSPLTLLVCSTLLLVFTYLSTNLFGHRGFIHSVPVGIITVLPLIFLLHNISYCLLAYVAWHSHLLGDGYLFKLK